MLTYRRSFEERNRINDRVAKAGIGISAPAEISRRPAGEPKQRKKKGDYRLPAAMARTRS